MRNGNLENRRGSWISFECFYLTYEEWKLRSFKIISHIIHVFLPYLWGMETRQQYLHQHNRRSFYLTYEEWKHSYKRCLRPIDLSFYLTYEEWKHTSRWRRYSLCKGFLPYLWGMETWYHHMFLIPYLGFYLTYEEWKPIDPCIQRYGILCFYLTYEEWKLGIVIYKN